MVTRCAVLLLDHVGVAEVVRGVSTEVHAADALEAADNVGDVVDGDVGDILRGESLDLQKLLKIRRWIFVCIR